MAASRSTGLCGTSTPLPETPSATHWLHATSKQRSARALRILDLHAEATQRRSHFHFKTVARRVRARPSGRGEELLSCWSQGAKIHVVLVARRTHREQLQVNLVEPGCEQNREAAVIAALSSLEKAFGQPMREQRGWL